MSSANTHISDYELDAIFSRAKNVFFVGIGGISMSGLAQITLKNGIKVTGSDRSKSPITDKLESLGATSAVTAHILFLFHWYSFSSHDGSISF